MALFLLLFFFAGLFLAIKAHSEKTVGDSHVFWSIAALLSAALFGYLSLSLITTSSPNHDSFYYYLGWSSILLNSTGVIIVIYNFIRNED